MNECTTFAQTLLCARTRPDTQELPGCALSSSASPCGGHLQKDPVRPRAWCRPPPQRPSQTRTPVWWRGAGARTPAPVGMVMAAARPSLCLPTLPTLPAHLWEAPSPPRPRGLPWPWNGHSKESLHPKTHNRCLLFSLIPLTLSLAQHLLTECNGQA